MDKKRVIIRPDWDQYVCQVTMCEHMLWPCFVLDDLLFHKWFRNPLGSFLVPFFSHSDGWVTYFVNVLGVFLVKGRLGDTFESTKKPLCEIPHWWHRRPKSKHSRGGIDVVSNKIFHSSKIWDRLSLLQALFFAYSVIIRYPSKMNSVSVNINRTRGLNRQAYMLYSFKTQSWEAMDPAA